MRENKKKSKTGKVDVLNNKLNSLHNGYFNTEDASINYIGLTRAGQEAVVGLTIFNITSVTVRSIKLMSSLIL